MKTELRFLMRRPWILFVTTPFTLVLAKLHGFRDGKRKRVRIIDEKLYSPHLEKVAHQGLSYQNKMYLKLLKRLKAPLREVRLLSQELENMANDYILSETKNKSLSRRQVAQRDSQFIANAQRKREILLRLSELGQELKHGDLSMAHHIERSINEVNKYYSSYCKGAMASVESGALQSAVFDRQPYAKKQYETQMNLAMDICNRKCLKGEKLNEMVGI